MVLLMMEITVLRALNEYIHVCGGHFVSLLYLFVRYNKVLAIFLKFGKNYNIKFPMIVIIIKVNKTPFFLLCGGWGGEYQIS